MNFGRKLVLSSAVIAFILGHHAARPCYASNVTAADSLRFVPDPQSAAMGESIVSFSGSPAVMIVNPAAMVYIYQPKLCLSDLMLWEGLRYNFAGFTVPTGMGTLGCSLSYLSYGKIQGYGYDGAEYDLPSTYDVAATFGYALPLKVDLPLRREYGSVGINVKFIVNKLANYSTEGVAFDFGGIFKVPFVDGLNAAVVYRNAGTSLKYTKDANALPDQARFGIRYNRPAWRNLALVADFSQDINSAMQVFSAGASIMPLYAITLRGGWIDAENSITSGVRWGIGMDFDIFSLNYAMSSFKDFTMSHQVGVDIPLGSIAQPRAAYDRYLDVYFQRAKDKYDERDYIAARQQIEEILSVYPGHKQSIAYLEKISVQLDKIDQRKNSKIEKLLRESENAVMRNDIEYARKSFNRILRIDPDNGAALDGLNKIEKVTGEVREQDMKQWKQALQYLHQGEYVMAKLNFEQIYAADTSRDDAKRMVFEAEQRIIEMSAGEINRFYKRGTALFKKGKYSQAVPYFEAVTVANPSFIDGQNYLLKSRQRIREIELGVENRETNRKRETAENEIASAFSNALRLYDGGNNYEALDAFMKCQEMALRHDFKEYLDRVNNFIATIRANIAEQYLRAGKSLVDRNDVESGLEEYRKGLMYDPGNAQVKAEFDIISRLLTKQYYEKGAALFKSGDAVAARQMFEKSLFYNPDNEEARNALGKISR
ncbi:MAG: hypothetical protein A2219_07860 [Elusimicrobia bacterium RIFOXYA2_FULL_50_26]|nr:MAG: hypothetical protein A2219_07860 [Elusimicrobia bacterium RIFOXYA2_FULL_50_26]